MAQGTVRRGRNASAPFAPARCCWPRPACSMASRWPLTGRTATGWRRPRGSARGTRRHLREIRQPVHLRWRDGRHGHGTGDGRSGLGQSHRAGGCARAGPVPQAPGRPVTVQSPSFGPAARRRVRQPGAVDPRSLRCRSVRGESCTASGHEPAPLCAAVRSAHGDDSGGVHPSVAGRACAKSHRERRQACKTSGA